MEIISKQLELKLSLFSLDDFDLDEIHQELMRVCVDYVFENYCHIKAVVAESVDEEQ